MSSTPQFEKMKKATPELKAGWQSTEFWVTALIVIATVFGWVEGQVDGSWAIAAGGVAAAAYSVSRGLAKRSNSDALRKEVLDVLVSAIGRHGGTGGSGGVHPYKPPAGAPPNVN